RLAAIAVVGLELGLVAHPDLPQLDPGLKLAGQVFDQLAEVHALLGQEVEDDPLAAEQVLDVYQLHLQLARADEAQARLVLLTLQLPDAFDALAVLGRHEAEDLAPRRLGDQPNDLRVRCTQDVADFLAALGAG